MSPISGRGNRPPSSEGHGKNGKRILYVESGTSGGGSFESLYHHLGALDRERWSPMVCFVNRTRYVDAVRELDVPVRVMTDLQYTLTVPRPVRAGLYRIGKAVHRVSTAMYVRFRRAIHGPLLRSLDAWIEEAPPHLFHLNDQIHRDLFGVFLASRRRVACVSHLRSNRSDVFGPDLAQLTNQIVSAYIAPSKAAADYWIGLGIDGDRLHVVPNALPERDVKPADVHRLFDLPAEAPTLVCVANFHAGKGHDFLLQSFALLRESRPDAVLLLVGSGPLESEMRKRARQIDLAGSVVFAGYHPDPIPLMAGADLVVVPSRTETFGRVVLEAWQAGTAVVATAVGGLPEIVENGGNGVLIPFGQPEALARTLGPLLADEPRRTSLAAAGRTTLNARFRIEGYAHAIEAIYGRISSGRGIAP